MHEFFINNARNTPLFIILSLLGMAGGIGFIVSGIRQWIKEIKARTTRIPFDGWRGRL